LSDAVEVDGSDRPVDVCSISEEESCTKSLRVPSKESADVNILGGTATICVIIGRIVEVLPGKMTVVVMLKKQAVVLLLGGNGCRASKTLCPGERASCRVTSALFWMQSEQGVASRADTDTTAPWPESVGSGTVYVVVR
jgi:hypothetical protein